MAEELQISFKEGTDVGKVRDHNEDFVFVPQVSEADRKGKGRLFIVADGMGGYQAGEVASRMAAEIAARVYYEDSSEDVTTRLSNAVQAANVQVHRQAQSDTAHSGMGTTMVAVALVGRTAYVASVGDSRAYVVHKGELNQITRDHSFVAEQVRAGILTKEQARTHPQRNVITRALGSQLNVQVDTFSGDLADGDVLVMCTDGLTGHVPDERIRDTVLQLPPEQAVPKLIQMAKDDGGSDNITVIALRVGPPVVAKKLVASPDASTMMAAMPPVAKPARKGGSNLIWIIGGVALGLSVIVVLVASVVAFDLLGTKLRLTPSAMPTSSQVVPIVTTLGGAPTATASAPGLVPSSTIAPTPAATATFTPRPKPTATDTPTPTPTTPPATETPKPNREPGGGSGGGHQ